MAAHSGLMKVKVKCRMSLLCWLLKGCRELDAYTFVISPLFPLERPEICVCYRLSISQEFLWKQNFYSEFYFKVILNLGFIIHKCWDNVCKVVSLLVRQFTLSLWKFFGMLHLHSWQHDIEEQKNRRLAIALALAHTHTFWDAHSWKVLDFRRNLWRGWLVVSGIICIFGVHRNRKRRY